MKKEKQSKNSIEQDIVVLYHNGCHDGFGGAWAAWKKFKNKALYVGVEHGKDIPAGLVDKDIYCIDFCYNEEVMSSLLAVNNKVVVLDHHFSQRDVVGISTEHVYDNDRSGSVIAWQYFFPKEAVPKLLKHIQDVDLWKFNVPHTKELMSALDEYEFDFKVWNKIAAAFEDKELIKKYLEAGRTILKYNERIIERLVRHAEHVVFEGVDAYAINVPLLESEIGNWIVEHKKAVAIMWAYKGGGVKVSLRSDGKTDVSALAQRYGGGGHKAAAGFAFDVNVTFPWVKVKKEKI
ncbi:MAG: Phosphohydrolase (DHH superfamily)-like protein [Candidatus Wolfebacteria bacterium GW2011_GWC2_39_22]|uniref:Phosphohydrolase (DHH superfamily)-like protein n=1 Tax=Candidatus Wolfebacteria bacterium GW2011_GWC2_39_22 TaxID=1619013 RepID=A0A0G0NIL7_9BACT|nr:MAG: Phosphohydrolase (DHH superfamily)-like protein [Candidatus Wolfebacteria bacterium GW2011_GWC2_39_22]HBI25691.1 hypothetical protein [Candidatus Wolfebacteria bacterium]